MTVILRVGHGQPKLLCAILDVHTAPDQNQNMVQQEGLAMSIGLGIFVSVLVAIAAWQIDKRKVWKKSGLWLGGSLLVLTAAFGAMSWWDSNGDVREARAFMKSVRAGEFIGLGKLRLGMSMDEVRYLKGAPTKNFIPDSLRGALWFYFEDESRPNTLTVAFAEDDTAIAIACSGNVCPSFGGVYISDSEAEVIRLLGRPDAIEGPDKEGQKMLRYGPEKKAQIEFDLTMGKVSNVAVVNYRAGMRSILKSGEPVPSEDLP